MDPLRIIFMGTAELACNSLEKLCTESIYQVVAVVTQPDRPRGRELKLTASAVKQLALSRNLPVLQPERARHPSFLAQLASLKPDLMVVAAYGQILPPTVLDLPQFGCLNVHTSLLPKHRGAAPIQWALLSGDTETGVTIMKMDPGLDTGDIVTQRSTSILPSDDAMTLHDRLACLGADLLHETIPGYVDGNIKPRPQPLEGVSYARKITREDGQIDWKQPAQAIWNRVRALTPWPGASTLRPAAAPPQVLKIWTAAVDAGLSGAPGEIVRADKEGIIVACGEHALAITLLQREGRKRLNPAEFLAGSNLRTGERLG